MIDLNRRGNCEDLWYSVDWWGERTSTNYRYICWNDNYYIRWLDVYWYLTIMWPLDIWVGC